MSKPSINFIYRIEESTTEVALAYEQQMQRRSEETRGSRGLPSEVVKLIEDLSIVTANSMSIVANHPSYNSMSSDSIRIRITNNSDMIWVPVLCDMAVKTYVFASEAPDPLYPGSSTYITLTDDIQKEGLVGLHFIAITLDKSILDPSKVNSIENLMDRMKEKRCFEYVYISLGYKDGLHIRRVGSFVNPVDKVIVDVDYSKFSQRERVQYCQYLASDDKEVSSFGLLMQSAAVNGTYQTAALTITPLYKRASRNAVVNNSTSVFNETVEPIQALVANQSLPVPNSVIGTSLGDEEEAENGGIWDIFMLAAMWYRVQKNGFLSLKGERGALLTGLTFGAAATTLASAGYALYNSLTSNEPKGGRTQVSHSINVSNYTNHYFVVSSVWNATAVGGSDPIIAPNVTTKRPMLPGDGVGKTVYFQISCRNNGNKWQSNEVFSIVFSAEDRGPGKAFRFTEVTLWDRSRSNNVNHSTYRWHADTLNMGANKIFYQYLKFPNPFSEKGYFVISLSSQTYRSRGDISIFLTEYSEGNSD